MDVQVAEVTIPRRCGPRAGAKRCSRCGSLATLGAYGSEGIPPANGPSLCLQCTELRSELEALSEEYRSCLTRLRQCRDELNHFQSEQAKVGGVYLPQFQGLADHPGENSPIYLCSTERRMTCLLRMR